MAQNQVNGNKSNGLTSYLQALPQRNMEPLWLKMNAMVPPKPNPRAVPYIWRYSESLPLLTKAAEIVPAEEAERRVLMLVNPTLESPYTTDTIYGGLQIVKPGETAPAHRHTAFAARFIISGEGFTAVEGKKMPLRRGDVILTPSWHWHDHGNESEGPVVWLDALNLPLFRYAPVNYAELYGESRYPSTPCEDCEWRHPWKQVEATLLSQKGPHTVYHYTSKGKPLSTTIGAQAERIDGHYSTTQRQESCSFMYHCYEGEGRTEIETPEGSVESINWASKDTFVVPAGSTVKHVNTSAERAYLVAFTDRPLLENLGLMKPF
ncbi:gentisate 1,2-dioxygenase [Annulohypoxylon maeteangense]|uniref:gentisate 1,2-dioxygenase n=1 Tax=Annulohypoxylon maeteangense TaxID=1927788 RepID=UPI0020083D85|nr:gentisate 1,2-dioxygenase [Annulohypoxylon maeteangense]KAI0886962.1 gentisate 1,2-dioxygenase [Annulohypoxylon maeteangense]